MVPIWDHPIELCRFSTTDAIETLLCVDEPSSGLGCLLQGRHARGRPDAFFIRDEAKIKPAGILEPRVLIGMHASNIMYLDRLLEI